MLTKAISSKIGLLRNVQNTVNVIKQSQRNGSHGVWSYRVPPPPPSKKSVYLATGLGGFAWYWILYHLATEPEHIYGEWPYVPPSTWTDEELGIPPDSAGPLNRI